MPSSSFFECWILSQLFHSPTFIKRLFSSSSLSAIRVESSAYLRLLIFLPAILIPACASSRLAFLMIYSAYKLNKQGDTIQPWCTTFSIWNQSVVSCCFLTCTQVSQEAGKVVWYSYLFKNFPQFVTHIVKGFGVVDKAEVDVFLNSLAFSMIQRILAIWSLVPLPFLNPAWTSWSYGSRTVEGWLGEFWVLLCYS